MAGDDYGFELLIRVADAEGAAGVDAQIRTTFDLARAELPVDADVESWVPRDVRRFGDVKQAFVTSVGLLTLTRVALNQVAAVLNELAVVLGDTAGADLVTIDVGGEIIPLSDVTPEMIESWLPPDSG